MIDNGQPTAIVYRTIKGWQYGIEGKGSHGAGHKLCADGFFKALNPFLKETESSASTDARQPTSDAGGVRKRMFWRSVSGNPSR